MGRVHHHVIAGYDGSALAGAAVRWAAREAHRRDCGLTVIGCCTTPLVTDYGTSAAAAIVAADVDALRTRTVEAVEQLADEVRDAHPDVAINAVALHGRASDVLAEQARNADLVVLGATGASQVVSTLLGSVAFALARTSPCPVVVVPATQPAAENRRIVVGIDTMDASAAALDWAIDEADLAGAELRVVHAWSYPYATDTPSSEVRDIVQVDAARELDRAVEHATARGGARVERHLADGDPADVIVAAAADADLVVVGSRGRGSIRSLVLGSVSHAVIAHAPCPTVIVRRSEVELR